MAAFGWRLKARDWRLEAAGWNGSSRSQCTKQSVEDFGRFRGEWQEFVVVLNAEESESVR